MKNYREGLIKIKAFIFDVDGVLGSDKVLLYSDGEILRTMNVKDGFALQYAVRKGYKIGIITGGASVLVRSRFERLGIHDIYLKSRNKIEDLNDFTSKYGLSEEEILYMGDDLPDYEVMHHVGIPTCPSDAAEEIKTIAQYISDKNGGEGAVRDVIRQVLRLQGNWMDADSIFW